MSNLLQNFKSATGSTSKNSYTLDEILGIMSMFQAGLSPKEVAQLTGRSVHSLRYKFLEGEITLNGESTIRSVKRFNSIQEIYTEYGVEWTGEADVDQRIANFKAKLQAKAKAS